MKRREGAEERFPAGVLDDDDEEVMGTASTASIWP